MAAVSDLAALPTAEANVPVTDSIQKDEKKQQKETILSDEDNGKSEASVEAGEVVQDYGKPSPNDLTFEGEFCE